MSRTQKGLLVAGLVAAAAALCATVFVPALVFFPSPSSSSRSVRASVRAHSLCPPNKRVFV